jgi:hypothetical protein
VNIPPRGFGRTVGWSHGEAGRFIPGWLLPSGVLFLPHPVYFGLVSGSIPLLLIASAARAEARNSISRLAA